MADKPGPGDGEIPFDPADPVFVFVRGILEFLDSVHGELDPTLLGQHVGTLLERHAGPEPIAGMSAAEQAQDLAYEAMDSEERGPYLALDALSLDPGCADAYVCLGQALGFEPDLAMAMFTLGAMAGAAAIGPGGFEREAGHFWAAHETRPFMRAVEGLARTAWGIGEPGAAAGYYQQLIQMNPNDNQGARYPLMAIALEVGDHELSAALFRAYDDRSAMWGFGKALDAFQRLGDSPESRAALSAAQAQNPFVTPYLTGAKEFPDDGPSLYTSGSEEEAIECADLLANAWEGTEGAVAWLNGAGSAPAAAPSKEKRQGPRSLD